jgi:hypothetical protein
MFKPDFIKITSLALVRRPMLKGALFVEAEVILQSVPTVRIPGGLTPP